MHFAKVTNQQGTRVWLYNSHRRKSIAPVLMKGPYIVTKHTSVLVYHIQLGPMARPRLLPHHITGIYTFSIGKKISEKLKLYWKRDCWGRMVRTNKKNISMSFFIATGHNPSTWFSNKARLQDTADSCDQHQQTGSTTGRFSTLTK